MSSSSDSEDENLKRILEAADTTLLTDNLFNSNKESAVETVTELPKSQRYLEEDDNGIDFVPTEAAQKLMSRRLASLVQDLVEFVKPDDKIMKTKKWKNRVKLLSGFDCYVKPFEEFEFDDIGPQVKPIIKRRTVDADPDEKDKLQSAAVDGAYVLSKIETKQWTKWKNGKVFHYKGKGKSHLVESDNEFSKTRRKNNWNESKIQSARFPKKVLS